MEIRRAEDRGKTEIGWLHGRHSFSFNRYYDPERMAYRTLRVLNDDVVEPGRGFGEHGHDNMEIITWVIDGVVRHGDSMGTNGEIRAGELQVMSAGRGIRHSEMNASLTQPVHLLQIWIEPNVVGLDPSYAQKTPAPEGRRGRWQTLVSSDGRDDSLRIHQDAVLQIAELDAGQKIDAAVGDHRHGYLHVAFGGLTIGDETLKGGDAVAVGGNSMLRLDASDRTQVLLFDLA